jgi:uncharacterized spore protein YtfJ
MANSGATEILDALMRNMRDIISTKTIVGDPIQNGDITILPVMKVSLGFGAGAGTGNQGTSNGNGNMGGGGGGGGGISITPVGFLVVDPKRALMITPKSSKWDWIADAVPEVLDKIGKMRGARHGHTEEEGPEAPSGSGPAQG